MIRKNSLHYIWHAVSVGLAVLTAVIVNHYAGFDQGGWLVLTTFLCCQTTRGTPLRQGIIFGFTIVLAVMLVACLSFMQLTILVYLVVAIVFVASAYFVFISRPLTKKEVFHFLLFAFVLAIATLAPIRNQTSISDYLLSIGTGAVIGIAFNQFFFSIRLDSSFFQGVMPLLKALKQYSVTLTNNLRGEADIDLLEAQKLQIEKSMSIKYSLYPNWVYETGFNPGLRAGWRYFLIHLEQATELYFSLDFLAHRRTDLSLLSEFISVAMQKNEELLGILIQYVESQQNIKVESDFTSDMTALEDALRRVVPNQIELLDISPDYIALTSLVRDLRDLRGILLQLVMTLPA